MFMNTSIHEGTYLRCSTKSVTTKYKQQALLKTTNKSIDMSTCSWIYNLRAASCFEERNILHSSNGVFRASHRGLVWKDTTKIHFCRNHKNKTVSCNNDGVEESESCHIESLWKSSESLKKEDLHFDFERLPQKTAQLNWDCKSAYSF